MDDMAAIAIVPDAKVDILPIPSRDAAGIWPLVVDYIKPVCEIAGGAYEPEDILAEIVRADQQLWLVMVDGEPKGCVVSRVLVHPRLTELFCPVVGGEGLNEWLEPMMDKLKVFARAKGCARIEGVGRRGWARAIPDMKEVASLMRMVL